MEAQENTFISPRLDLNVGEVVDNVPNEAANVNVSVEELRARMAGNDGMPFSEAPGEMEESAQDQGGTSFETGCAKSIDIVFMFVHGASFSSKLFDSNLKEFLGSLTDVNQNWFWELDLNFHVEMIDWKSCLAPYQFKSISRCMPVESIYETEDDLTDNVSSSDAAPHSQVAAAEDGELFEAEKSGISDISAPPADPGDRTHVRSESMLRGFSRYFKWGGGQSSRESQPQSPPREGEDEANGRGGGGRSDETDHETDGLDDNKATMTEPPPGNNDDISRPAEPETERPNRVSQRRNSRVRRGSHASNIPLEPSNIQEFYELQKKHGLRVYFSNTVVDVMFYLTARFGGFMVTQVGRMLNQRVRDLRESPCGRFKNSQVVLVGHSLGSVILYELLAQRPLRATEYDEVDKDETSLFSDQNLPAREDADGAVIDFDVKHLFLWGSPLSSFLVLKNDKSFQPDGALTKHRGKDFRMYNIFHRSDPIATRIEPIFYRDRDYIPPAVRIPSYHHGDVLRRGLELVAKNSVRAAATMFVNKLFSNGNGSPSGTEDWVKKLVSVRRYALPDVLDRLKRFGVLTLSGIEMGSAGRSVEASSLNLARHPDALTEGISESILLGGADSLADDDDDARRVSLVKGDSCDKTACVLDEVDDSRDPRHAQDPLPSVLGRGGHKPWTVRQLALNCCRKLRKKAIVKIHEKVELIQAEKRRPILLKLFPAIDAEFDYLLSSICSVGINKVEPLKYAEEGWMDERKLSECLRQWQVATLRRELLLTSQQLRQEIIKSLTCKGSEIEREGSTHYPVRLDFCIAGGIQEMLIAPLGLLQSHLKYWGDRDTCLFMLKMITGFTPQISLSRREIIVNEAQKCKERVMRLIQKIVR